MQAYAEMCLSQSSYHTLQALHISQCHSTTNKERNVCAGMCCGVSQNSYHTVRDMRVVLADGSVLDTADAASRGAFAKSHAALLDGVSRLATSVQVRRHHVACSASACRIAGRLLLEQFLARGCAVLVNGRVLDTADTASCGARAKRHAQPLAGASGQPACRCAVWSSARCGVF